MKPLCAAYWRITARDKKAPPAGNIPLDFFAQNGVFCRNVNGKKHGGNGSIVLLFREFFCLKKPVFYFMSFSNFSIIFLTIWPPTEPACLAVKSPL